VLLYLLLRSLIAASNRSFLAVRLQLILPTDKVAAIDQFRFQARMPSRAAAVRELLRRGLASAQKEQETPKSRGSTGAPRSVTTCALPQYGRAGIYRWLPRLPGSASSPVLAVRSHPLPHKSLREGSPICVSRNIGAIALIAQRPLLLVLAAQAASRFGHPTSSSFLSLASSCRYKLRVAASVRVFSAGERRRDCTMP
jgi:hypothetical protein